MPDAERQKGQNENRLTVGVIADPVAMPALIGEQLAQDLPQLLTQQVDSEQTWAAQVHWERLPPSDSRHTAMMELAETKLAEHGWDMVVCVTDLPMRSGKRAIMGDMNSQRRVVVVSLPAFGVMALRRRVGAVVAQLVADMHRPVAPQEGTAPHARNRIPLLAARFRRHTPDQAGVDARISSRWGNLRLLLGMVRANRPWRLTWSLTSPLVGAFAFSAFYLLNATVWEIATTLSAWRLALAVMGALSVMTGWLIVYHNLWEPVRARPRDERQQAVLFNATTVLTLGLGIAFLYVGLYLVNLTAALVLLSPGVLDSYIAGQASAGTYVLIPVLVTAAATVAGAIGSGFESEESVRNAAFSRRERERREAFRERHEQRQGSLQERGEAS
ncbi:hypothetical protein [Nocardiopsis alba]|uniref:hypothetical protein n=1 Tax=Nocardiopsis alba TaxID=53437 RepID=UPI00034A2ED8|nr:hypothetical protein [Nocardiopsis alba]